MLDENLTLNLSIEFAAGAVTHTITVNPNSSNTDLAGLVQDIQQAIDQFTDWQVDGESAVQVGLGNGGIIFTSGPVDFSVMGMTGADQIGLVANELLRSSRSDIEIDWPAVLETIDASIELVAGEEAWIKGDLIAGGAGRDVILSANRTLKLSGNITASDLVELSAGTSVVEHQISIITEKTGRMLVGNASTNDSGRIVMHGLNDVVIGNTITLTNTASHLNITSDQGDVYLTTPYGIINTAGEMQIQADIVNIDGSVSSTANTASGYEVEIVANESANLNGSLLATGSIHVDSQGAVAVTNQLRASGQDSQVLIDADTVIEIGGEGLSNTGLRKQLGTLISASGRVDLTAGTNIIVNAASDVLVTQQQGVISLDSEGNISLVGALHAGAQLQVAQDNSTSINWDATTADADIEILAAEKVEIGGFGIDDFGLDVPRGIGSGHGTDFSDGQRRFRRHQPADWQREFPPHTRRQERPIRD